MTTKRAVTISPYVPDDTENLGDNTGQFSDKDIGKALKYSGDTMVPCATGDEIAGFVTSVEPGTKDGHSIGAVRKKMRVEALDEVGTLAVGNLVSAGTAGTLGTYALQNVKVDATALLFPWMVINAPGEAGGVCILERL